jgi:16S rRNA U516 pseudouridylate synthase RsuA-like enzyme
MSLKVTDLQRISIKGLSLDGLPIETFRVLSEKNIKKIVK